MQKKKLTLICFGKASDAYLAESLERDGFQLKIMIFKIPVRYWMSWILRRIKHLGVLVFLGHLLLSLWIRVERLLNRLSKKDIWKDCGTESPAWHRVNSKPRIIFSEQKLLRATQDAEIILLTDSMRLHHTFYRKNKARVLQLIWGACPKYLGDSGGFWAYAVGDRENIGPTLVERGSQYDCFSVLKQFDTELGAFETLRSIKVKQVREVTCSLSSSLELPTPTSHRSVTCKTFCAPTAFTYVRFLKHHSLDLIPSYASKEHSCSIAS